MTTILTILTDGFADWETGLLNGAARGFYGISTLYASPGGRQVTSTGGMKVVPDLALADIDIGAVDAIVVCGGTIWQQPDAPDLTALLNAAHSKGKVIGAICDGTLAAARAGILDGVRHTSNGAGYLDATGYKGQALYEDVPQAVSDSGIVTASATAPVAFMAAVMDALGRADESLAYYLGLHAAQHGAPAKAA